MSTILDACQYAVDEIHRLTQLLSQLIFKTDKVMIKRGAVAAMKELQGLGTALFKEGGQNVHLLMDEEFPALEKMISSMCEKAGVDSTGNELQLQNSQNEIALSSLLEDLKKTNFVNGLAIQEAILFVRSCEAKYTFQQNLWNEKQDVMKDLDCSVDNLTYGTSSLTLWAELMSQETIKRALAPGAERLVVFFGASQGLLALYTHALAVHHGLHTPDLGTSVDSFNTSKITGLPLNKASIQKPHRIVRCVGYEVLPTLWAVSNYLSIKHFRSEHNDHISFNLQDMLQADVTRADIVVLTSLCWDTEIRKLVAQKLANEMKPGSVVVDYRAETFSEFGLDPSAAVYETSCSSVPSQNTHRLASVAMLCQVNADLRSLDSALQTYVDEMSHSGQDNAACRRFKKNVFSEGGSPSGLSRIYRTSQLKRRYSKGDLVALKPTVLHRAESGSSRQTKASVESEIKLVPGRFELRSIIEGSCSWATWTKQPLYIYVKVEM